MGISFLTLHNHEPNNYACPFCHVIAQAKDSMKGTDVVFIQKLLGHNNLKTTLRYLHVTNKDLVNILSPLEDIKDFL